MRVFGREYCAHNQYPIYQESKYQHQFSSSLQNIVIDAEPNQFNSANNCRNQLSSSSSTNNKQELKGRQAVRENMSKSILIVALTALTLSMPASGKPQVSRLDA